MGVSFYAYVFLGFRVNRDDLIQTTEARVATCPDGHRQKGKALFCCLDGGEFKRAITEKPTKALKLLHEFHNYTYDEEDSAENNMQGLLSDEYGPLFALHGNFCAGVSLSTLGWRKEASIISDAEFQERREQVIRLRDALGMTDRDIQLYHVMLVS